MQQCLSGPDASRGTCIRFGLQQFDDVDLAVELRRRALALQSAPTHTRLRGVLRFALRTGLELAVAGVLQVMGRTMSHAGGSCSSWHLACSRTASRANRVSSALSLSGVLMHSAEANGPHSWELQAPPIPRGLFRTLPLKGLTSSAELRTPPRLSTLESSLQRVGPSQLALPVEPLAASNDATLAELRTPTPKRQSSRSFRRYSTMSTRIGHNERKCPFDVRRARRPRVTPLRSAALRQC